MKTDSMNLYKAKAAYELVRAEADALITWCEKGLMLDPAEDAHMLELVADGISDEQEHLLRAFAEAQVYSGVKVAPDGKQAVKEIKFEKQPS